MATPRLTEYYSKVNASIKAFEDFYQIVSLKMSKIENPEFDTTDWYGTLWGIQTAINQLNVMANAHKFERISKDQMQAIFRAFENQVPTGKIVISIQHTVTDFDTLRLLQVKYGTPWQTILDFNDLLPTDIVTGVILQIPVQVSAMIPASTQIAVVGDQSGENILGTDLPNELVDDGNGDLEVLEPEDSFQQTINNLIETVKGDYPYYENFGADLKLSEDYPAGSQTSAIQVKLLNALSAEPRIKEVTILDISKNGNAINAKIQVQPLIGEPIAIST